MLSLENYCLYYKENEKILDEITLRIDDGTCVLFTGVSGSGKSSIVNSINGLVFSYENARMTGSIQIDGREIGDMELYEISMFISSVFQNPKTHFFNVDTTSELLFYLENTGLDRGEMERRMADMLALFPIGHLLGRSIFELSGGEKQILCVAACYISGCRMIVLDEPSSNLDDRHIAVLGKMLKILKRQGITLVLAEHRMYYLTDIVDRIFLLDRGKIYAVYGRDEFLSFSDKELSKMGLRSTRKPVLKKRRECGDGDLIIKKANIRFNIKNRFFGKNTSPGDCLHIENLSFCFGKIYGITGKNGCGKSTFLRFMTGLGDTGRNEIVLEKTALRKKNRIRKSSLVMQDVNHQLFTESVAGEVRLGTKNTGQEKVKNILSSLGLTDLADRHPMSLSGGEKQRVAIASVLCRNTPFLFFDEPTSGMDYNNMMKISGLIKKMTTEENIIFIVSHDVEFLNETADVIVDLESFRTAQ